MSADLYLRNILIREREDTGPFAPVRGVIATMTPLIQQWANSYLFSVCPSGSFAKGTANRSGTDIDLFISLSAETPFTLEEIYARLFRHLVNSGYDPRKRNVSINTRVGAFDVDLVPGRRQDAYSEDHSLWRDRANTWTKTNVQTHIAFVRSSNRLEEVRLLKLWRNQKGLDFPSFYLELATITALVGQPVGNLSANVWKAFEYLRDLFTAARTVDPANTNNIVSDDLTAAEKGKVRAAAVQALAAKNWSEIIV